MSVSNTEIDDLTVILPTRKLVWRWRVIVRLSFDNDSSSKLRSLVSKLLKDCGLQNTGTGIWESKAVPAKRAAEKLSHVLGLLAEKTEGRYVRAMPDHIWIYIDKVQAA
jgi:hypothetical protein